MKIVKIPDFLSDATNVYRTDEYIVKQQIVYKTDETLGTFLFSRDTYYRCTAKRRGEYEAVFADRINKDGTRIHATVYVRKYVD